MKKSIEKMKKKDKLFLSFERTRKILKSIFINSTLSTDLRKKAHIELSKLPKDSSIVRHKKLCVVTGRARSINSGYRLSRLMLQKLSRNGMLTGFRKSS